MDVVLALTILGVLTAIVSSSSAEGLPSHRRRQHRRAVARLAQRLGLVDCATPVDRALYEVWSDVRVHAGHRLRVGLRARGSQRVVVEIDFQRPFPAPFDASVMRRTLAQDRLELRTAREPVLAVERLLDRIGNHVLDAARHDDDITRIRVDQNRLLVTLASLPGHRHMERVLDDLVRTAARVQDAIIELDDARVAARRVGFLPASMRHFAGVEATSITADRIELDIWRAGWSAPGRVVIDGTTLSVRPPATAHDRHDAGDDLDERATFSLSQPLAVHFSRSRDHADALLLHVELRQRDADGAWQRTVLSSRTSQAGAPVDALPRLSRRGAWLAEEDMHMLLGVLRAVCDVHGTPLDRDEGPH